MSATGRLETVRDNYRAYESGDRALIDRILSPDFTFYSPRDDGINRATYFERCWPSTEILDRFELVRLVEADGEVYVTYEATRTDGTSFRNTEIFGFDGDKIAKVEVYFGWELA